MTTVTSSKSVDQNAPGTTRAEIARQLPFLPRVDLSHIPGERGLPLVGQLLHFVFDNRESRSIE